MGKYAGPWMSDSKKTLGEYMPMHAPTIDVRKNDALENATAQPPTLPADCTLARTSRWDVLFAPVVAPMMRDRRWAVAFGAVAVMQISAGYFGFRTFECPMKAGTGIPCPGCGLSRACGAILKGDWGDCLAFHAMAPFFLGGAVLMVLSVALPRGPRDVLTDWVERTERRTRLAPIILAMTLVYWLIRLVYAGANY